MLFVFDYITCQYKTHEMCDTVVSEDPSLMVYFPNKYKTQRMCDEAVDNCLSALKLVPDWCIKSEMIKKLFTALYADKNILCFNEGSDDTVFKCSGMDILNIDLNDIDINNNFDEDDADTIILIRLLAWHIKT